MGNVHSSNLAVRVHDTLTIGDLWRTSVRRLRVGATAGARLARQVAETVSLAFDRQGRPSRQGKRAADLQILIRRVNEKARVLLATDLSARLSRSTAHGAGR